MLQSPSSRILIAKLFKAPLSPATLSQRYTSKDTITNDTTDVVEKQNLMPSADPREYGVTVDSIEHAWGVEKKMIIARLMGDDRYEPKVYYRAENSSLDYPNLVPCHFSERIVMCKCETEAPYLVEWYLRKDGKPKRCECGHWFKAVDADPESF